MQSPKKFITRMTLFMVVVVLIAVLLRNEVAHSFMANPALNGVIIGTLLIGMLFAYRRVFDLKPEIEWIKAFKRQEAAASSVSPKLMAPAASLLSAQAEGSMRLSTLSMRSVLDGIASRLEESREISRYFTSLLIFLGLLGTFWGLLGTISAIGGTIKGLSVSGGGDMALMFDELKAGLEAPLSGMGTAFSSSLFGLAGSLTLGFLDLQASQAQTRFYNAVEDWLASVTHLSRGEMSEGVSSPSAYMTALMEQTADGIEKLERTIKHGEESRAEAQAAMGAIAESLSALSDRMTVQADQAKRTEETSKALAVAIEKLAAGQMAAHEPKEVPPVLDDTTKQHIRNLDVGIKRLIEEQIRTSGHLADELRTELKLVSRTIAAGFDTAGRNVAPAPERPVGPSVSIGDTYSRRKDEGATSDNKTEDDAE
ncbi:hypothetical protein [Kordiimonas marina]|uniref:hypothetical protein n=1 Tax=Kordiimonas marina TaxID=2872312 RepID=UPI001FF5F7BF|nr:hypothetical protein [Kordiimonas marina]MCJ9427912.1 hypothetical protein [Kordiimonas marina]